MNINDKQFKQQFDNLSLPKEYFNHLGHLRIAWIYLQEFPQDVAIEKLCRGINAYASSLGASDKFHKTLTEATTRILAQRIEQSKVTCFSEFLIKNQDIVTDLMAVIKKYYSTDLLNSELAKKSFIEPDLKALEEIVHE